ncbi:hypothetical protein BW35_02117 [Micrococcus luteus]|nr:hypothetical protein BW35_02117 [Micrococcus luteus]
MQGLHLGWVSIAAVANLAAVPHSPENLPTPFARASSHAASTSGRKRSLPSKTAGSP